MKEKIKTLLQYSIVPIIIIGIILGWRACKKHDEKEHAAKIERKKQKENERKQALLVQPFLFFDKNGVYHIDDECKNLHLKYRRRHWRDEDEVTEDIDKSYSAAYIPKNSIKNWYDFAAAHQLCSECFSPQLIHQLDSIKRISGGRLTNPYWQMNIETDDERYRDADEEYYNINDKFNGLFD